MPIPIQLPKPMFEGTPQNLTVPNLQKPLGRPRDPFLAPAGVTNVAKGKKVTSSDMEPVIGEIEQVTDGDKKGADGSFVELGPAAAARHRSTSARRTRCTPSSSGTSTRRRASTSTSSCRSPTTPTSRRTSARSSTTITTTPPKLGAGKDMNYVETAEGKLVDAKGARARYVRLYSRGNNANELNHYVEVEVFGRPAK